MALEGLTLRLSSTASSTRFTLTQVNATSSAATSTPTGLRTTGSGSGRRASFYAVVVSPLISMYTAGKQERGAAGRWKRCTGGYVVIGNPTVVLPLGTATYEGRSRWDDFLRDDSNSGRRRSVSDVTLNIDFDSATVDGVFDNFEHWTSGAPRVQSDTVLRIENGEITSTGFSAQLAQDMAPTSTFAGTMTGQFFGSDADEVGGALEGSSDARVFIGWFEGTKD